MENVDNIIQELKDVYGIEVYVGPEIREKKKIENKKGKSIIDFPDSFVIMDFETTGLDRDFDKIIEIGAIKVESNTITDSFQTLINPGEEIDEFITELTGITNEMVSNCPSIDLVVPDFLVFLGDLPIVGHNISFDINFLCANTEKIIYNDYINTLRLCRKLYSQEKHHRLKDMVNLLSLEATGAHRAYDDCLTTLALFTRCKSEAVKQYGTLDLFYKSFKNSRKRLYDISKIIPDENQIDETNLFYDKECVFTGKLERIKREDAMQLVVNIGGRVRNSVTKLTNFLILGNNDYCKTIVDGKSSKQKKAEALKLKGQDIEIISEQTFYDLLNI